MSIDEHRSELVHSLGENIQIKRLLGLAKTPSQSVGIYSHMGGKIVTVIVIEGSDSQHALAKEVALHVAAASPSFISPEAVPAAVLETEKEIARSQVQNKPVEIQERICDKKIDAYYEQACLLNQKYVKDPSITIKEFVEKEASKAVHIAKFVRWQVGD